MSDPSEAVLESAVPIFPVRDLAQAIDYYQRVLGFKLEWTWGDPPRLASVGRDRIAFNLALRDTSINEHVGKAYILVTGLDHFYAQIIKAGALIALPLAERAYGMKDCCIRDPDGNEISFGEATAP